MTHAGPPTPEPTPEPSSGTGQEPPQSQPPVPPPPGPAPYPYLQPPAEHPGHLPPSPPPAQRPFGQPPFAQPPFAQPPFAQPPFAQAGAPVPPAGAYLATPPRPPRPAVPGWVWPLVAVTALVVGLLGGLLGGALVLGTRPDTVGTGGGPIITGAKAPLAADNHSVAAVAAKVVPSTVQVRVLTGKGPGAQGATGSGFVIDHSGHVITNNHVVQVALGDGTGTDLGKATITVFDESGRPHSATVVGRSPVYDVAVLEVKDAKNLQPASLGLAGQMRVGQTVVAIGSPLGLSSTVTSGIVSALDRPVTTGSGTASSYIDAVQTDAAINPGNSGGPLVNMRGEVVGMNSAIATTGGSSFGSEPGNIGVGFAIPMEQVRLTAGQILATGKAEYPVIGASVNTADTTDGAKIVNVPSGTPAYRAGLRKGDRVVAVAGQRVTDGISLIVAIRAHQPGDTLSFTVVRDGHERAVRITLDAKVG